MRAGEASHSATTAPGTSHLSINVVKALNEDNIVCLVEIYRELGGSQMFPAVWETVGYL